MNKDFFNEALKQSILSYKLNEIPVGALISRDFKIISKAHNLKESHKNSTHHAEILCIEEACKILNTWDLKNYSMYVTLEPCLMCAGAILESRIKNLYIGASNPYNGFFSSNYHKPTNNLKIFWINDKRCEFILNRFFKQIRKGLKCKP